jgi:hypothetical protein
MYTCNAIADMTTADNFEQGTIAALWWCLYHRFSEPAKGQI